MLPFIHTEDDAYLLVPAMSTYSRYIPFSRSSPHYHSVYHLVFILSGEGVLEKGHSRFPMLPGTVMMINPGEKHLFIGKELTVENFAFNFYLIPESRLQERGYHALAGLYGNAVLLEELAEKKPLEEVLPVSVVNSRLSSEQIALNWSLVIERIEAFHKNVALFGDDENRYRDEKGIIAYYYQCVRFLIDFYNLALPDRCVPSIRPSKNRHDALTSIILNYLEKNIENAYDLQTTAHKLGYAPAYLCSHFKKITGATIGDHFMQLKIARACRLLVTTKLSISAVGDRLSFSSPQHFSSVFHRVKGVTPFNYRKEQIRFAC